MQAVGTPSLAFAFMQYRKPWGGRGCDSLMDSFPPGRLSRFGAWRARPTLREERVGDDAEALSSPRSGAWHPPDFDATDARAAGLKCGPPTFDRLAVGEMKLSPRPPLPPPPSPLPL